MQTPAFMVETTTLGDLVAALLPVHLIKMDIQGTVLAALEAARTTLSRGLIRHAVIGTHGQQLHRSVLKLLTEVGYEVVLEGPTPVMQPDGLIMATHANSGAADSAQMGGSAREQ